MMVSVITPIYNVHRFIEHGVQQVLQQTYKDFELILVDDGSTDGSYGECQRWVSVDKRIKVLHQQNTGAGGARNLGIENAKGEYIYFFDIDDEIRTNLLEYSVGKMEELDVDFICFGYENIETTYNSRVVVEFPEVHVTSNKDLKTLYVDQFVLKVNGFPWNKFYRRSFLNKNGLRYENQRIQQDEVFNLKCYRYLEKAYLSPEILYTYFIYEKGNTRSRFIADRFDIYKSVRQHFEDLKTFWGIEDDRFDDYLNVRFFDGVDQTLRYNLLHPNNPWSYEEKKNELCRVMKDDNTKQAIESLVNKLSFEQRLYLCAYKRQSISLIKLYNYIFTYLRKTKRILSK